MKLWEWYKARGPTFVTKRAGLLTKRYGLSPAKAQDRIYDCLTSLMKEGGPPTFPTPGVLVERYPDFIRRLQDGGAEIAVHGYQHVNLNDFPLNQARQHLERAVRAFERLGIQAHGFRSPYIGCSDELIDTLPEGLFSYSSNKAVRWHHLDDIIRQANGFYNTLEKFYHAKDSRETVCVPWRRSHLVEIPVCVPDDLQILDGLPPDVGGLTWAWQQILQQTYQRGELFTLLFHTELAEQCERPLVDLLCAVRGYRPLVWIARLNEIAEWWKEKSEFTVEIIPHSSSLMLKFSCTPRATILARGLGPLDSGEIWDGPYYRQFASTLKLPSGVRPFIGLDNNAPDHIATFLQEQGYIVQTGEIASACGIYLDPATLSRLNSQVQIIDHIEASSTPLVRFWRWPDGAKSVLSITGDLDALSLIDYASRVFFR
jgi:peptidoglycan/xylan/chitin deacetylase (PgdA/CDA1 family)